MPDSPSTKKILERNTNMKVILSTQKTDERQTEGLKAVKRFIIDDDESPIPLID